jgi:hypothetical protein
MPLSEKALPAILSTEAGMQIEISEAFFSKAQRPITVKLDPGTNVMLERDLHLAKQQAARTLTEAGMAMH